LAVVQNVFQWGGKQGNAFDALKQKINTAPILSFPNLRQSFKFQVVVCDYAMGAVFMQCGKPIYFHS